MSVVAVGAAVGAAASIGGVALQASAGAKQKYFMEQQAMLNNMANEQLAKAQMASNDRNTRIKIVADSVSNIKAAQSTTKMQMKQNADMANQKNMIILTIGGAVVITASAYVLTRK